MYEPYDAAPPRRRDPVTGLCHFRRHYGVAGQHA
jgi:hypothetical protein